MSESDSDFAYESADEDSTQDTGEQKCGDQESVKSIVSNEDVCILTEENKISETSDDSCVEKSCSDQVEKIEFLTLDDTIVNSTVPCEGTEDSDPNISSACKNSSNQENEVSKKKTEPKRVKLRLEKKLQERDQVQNTAETDSKETETSSQDSVCHTVQEEKPQSWGWGSWGTSILSSAASSVSTFTNQVSQGIGTVIETVESTLGAPPPEELAASIMKRKESAGSSVTNKEVHTLDEQIADDGSLTSGTGLLSGVSSFTKAIENTGTKVLKGGLDTLELIGKTTIDILTEGDPGLRKKRAVFSENVNLSQVLRDAKERAEEINSSEIDGEQEETVHYSKYFDEFQGLVHLEALEILSEQSQSKVQSISMAISDDITKKNLFDEIRNICENLPSTDDTSDDEIEQDFVKFISEHSDALQLSLKPEKLLQVQASVSLWLQECLSQQNEGKQMEPKVLYSKAISSLAEFTAKSVEQFHKAAELILIQPDLPTDVLHCATHLTGLASTLSIEIGIMSSRFCSSLSTAADDSEDPDSVTPLITSVYLEASNSTTYIQDAFQLLIPILQLAGLK